MAPNKKQKLNVNEASKKNDKTLKTVIASLTKKSEEVEKSIVEKKSSKQHETHWIKFNTFCSENELEDPSFVANNASKIIKLRLVLKCCAEGLGFKTAEGARSRVRSHRSRNLKPDSR